MTPPPHTHLDLPIVPSGHKEMAVMGKVKTSDGTSVAFELLNLLLDVIVPQLKYSTTFIMTYIFQLTVGLTMLEKLYGKNSFRLLAFKQFGHLVTLTI